MRSPYRFDERSERLDRLIPRDRRRLRWGILAFVCVLGGAGLMRASEEALAWAAARPAATPPRPTKKRAPPAPKSFRCGWTDTRGAEHAVLDNRCASVDAANCVWIEVDGSAHYLDEVREDAALWAACQRSLPRRCEPPYFIRPENRNAYVYSCLRGGYASSF